MIDFEIKIKSITHISEYELENDLIIYIYQHFE